MIEIVRESEELSSNFGEQYELCCFCSKPSPYWHEKKDVCVCQGCAKIRDEDEVPTKKEWFEQVKATKKTTAP